MPPKVSSAYKRLARCEWPSSFPLVQFPNPPLIVALLASLAATLSEGTLHQVARALFYMALTVWAYEELRDGENWFRRLLGLGFSIYILATLAHALDS
jgi:hypothetical protein